MSQKLLHNNNNDSWVDKSSSKKVNLGCGPRWKEDWINIDHSWNARIRRNPMARRILPAGNTYNWPQNLIVRDLRKKLPFVNETVDFVFASHVIEHLKEYECKGLLKESYRVLRKGGILRVVTPDLEILAVKYLQRDQKFYIGDNAWERTEKDTFADRFLTAFYERTIKKQILRERIRHNLFSDTYHQWLYDFESLSIILQEIGFQTINRCTFGQGRTPDAKFIDNPDPMSMYIEAQK